MPRPASTKTTDTTETERILKTHSELVGVAACAADLLQKRGDLQRIEALHLRTGRYVRLYQSAQNREKDAAEALRQALLPIPLQEMSEL